MNTYPDIQRRDGTLFFTCDENDRIAIATTIERLIDRLDAMDGDPDLEPYLAGRPMPGEDDREADLDAFNSPEISEGDDAENEPELGWTEALDQEKARMTHFAWWATDGEPDLGWTGHGTGFVETREACTC